MCSLDERKKSLVSFKENKCDPERKSKQEKLLCVLSHITTRKCKMKVYIAFLATLFTCLEVNGATLESLTAEIVQLTAELKAYEPTVTGVLKEFNEYKANLVEMSTDSTEEISELQEAVFNELKKEMNATLANQTDVKRAETNYCDKLIKKLPNKKKFNQTFKKIYSRLRNYEDKMNNLSIAFNEETTPLKAKLQTGELRNEEKEEKAKKVEELKEDFYKLAKHIQAIQLHDEERVRTDGQSGIKQIRVYTGGAENYFSNTHTGFSFSAIHDHSNNIRTVGMGEFIGILNGVQFRTRHNDYRLFQAAVNDTTYHKTQKVKFPDVPPEVLEKATPEDQIVEMREWFKAWVNQNHTVRDYRKYFKPVLTYLEGAWTVSEGDKIDEPFDSDRHFIDAKGWFELQEKIRFTSYTGAKSRFENLAHLPTKIMRFTENKQPVLARWNYRILCHPVGKDIPTSFFDLRYDEAAQRRNKRSDEQFLKSRSARFDIEGIDVNGRRDKGVMEYNFLDSIMEEIPGKDNYGASIKGRAFLNSGNNLFSANPNTTDKPLNSAYYHRTFIQKSQSGKVSNQKQRTFSDRVYVAETTSERIAYSSYNNWENSNEEVNTRVSFAVPIEIIYLTPLNSWNPYHVREAKTTTGNGDQNNPFSAASSRVHYMTPNSFFTGNEFSTNTADTARSGVSYILTQSNDTKAVRASGVRIFFPEVEGINGQVRQRYPIMPIFGEGSALWKKLNALEDAMKYDPEQNGEFNGNYNYMTGPAHTSNNKETGHRHPVYIDDKDLEDLLIDKVQSLSVFTEVAGGHMHNITVALNDVGELYIKDCGKEQSNLMNAVCSDNHVNTLVKADDA